MRVKLDSKVELVSKHFSGWQQILRRMTDISPSAHFNTDKQEVFRKNRQSRHESHFLPSDKMNRQ